MAERKEDISVRINADYTKALGDIQRFTGLVDKAFGALPKVVQDASTSVDKLTERIGKTDAAFDALPKVVQNVATSVEKLTERIEKMGRNDGADKLKNKLRQSNQEATLLANTFDRLQTSGKAIGAAMAGWQAGKAVLAPVVHTTMDYGMRLAQATNVSLLGGSIDEKITGMAKLDAGVMKATRYSGGKREELLEAAESLIARNSLGNMDDTLKVLPFIGMIAKAGNASAVDVGQATSGLVKSLGVPVDEVPAGLAKILYGGAIGGSEIKHMAHYFPQQSAAAKNAGMSGSSAVAKMVALNELAVDYSGTPDQAGINTTDFLNSMNSAHLANNLKRFSFDKKTNSLVQNNGQKRTGKNYLDLGHLLASNAEKGVDAVDTMIQIVGMISKGDPKYVEAVKKRDVAKKRLDDAKKRGDTGAQMAATEELSGIADNVTAILLGRGIGKLFHNQQELRGGIGVLTNPDAYHDMVKQINKDGTIKMAESEHEFIAAQPGYKAQLAEENKADAVYRSMEGFNGWLGKLAEKTSALYEKYPALAAAMEGGKVGVMTLGASAGVAAGVMALLGRNATLASIALGKVGGNAGVDGIPGVPKGTGGFGKTFLRNLKGTGAMAAVGAGYDAYDIYSNDKLTAQQKKIGYTGAVGGALGGALGGAVAGAAMGSVFPVVGTAIGGLIGGGLGYWGGHEAGTMAGAAMFGSKDPDPQRVAQALQQSIKSNPIEAKLQLKIAFDEMGKPVVSQTNLSGTNFRLDTGPMMTH
ncbi:hypothetical protein [Herminiimonas sp. CN]|uniref:hypothetical protein n=1 Tax=Herminiimonas sp. CN TaxID=1349818 RepID=UPI0004734C09|nr:hypothetical protein [Herminiimonas sp. CN]